MTLDPRISEWDNPLPRTGNIRPQAEANAGN